MAKKFTKLTIGGGELPTLNAPTIALDGSTLTITDTDNGNFAESYDIYNSGALVANTESTTFDLSTLFTEAGDYNITVKAKGTNFNDSADSNSVTYSISAADDSVMTGTWLLNEILTPYSYSNNYSIKVVHNGYSYTHMAFYNSTTGFSYNGGAIYPMLSLNNNANDPNALFYTGNVQNVTSQSGNIYFYGRGYSAATLEPTEANRTIKIIGGTDSSHSGILSWLKTNGRKIADL